MKQINRRNFLKVGVSAAGSIPVIATALASLHSVEALGQGSAKSACDPTKPPASGLQYVKDASKSETRTKAKRTSEYCYNCIQYAQAKRQAKQAVPKTGQDTCVLLPTCLAEAKGWCMVWVKAPA